MNTGDSWESFLKDLNEECYRREVDFNNSKLGQRRTKRDEQRARDLDKRIREKAR